MGRHLKPWFRSAEPKRSGALVPAAFPAFVALFLLLFPVAPGEADGAPGEVEPSTQRLQRLVEDLVGDRAARTAARRQLEEYGAESLPHLIARARDPQFSMRWEVVNMLGNLQQPAAVATLVERITEDRDPHVRWRAMWAIQRIPDGTVADRLAAVCRGDGVRAWNACVGLSLFADSRALPRLRQGLTSTDSWVRWEAIDSLGRVHDGQTSKLLVEHLGDPKERVRQEIVLSLAQIGDTTAVEALLQALGDGSSAVRWRAAMGLARCAGSEHLALLENRLVEARDADTRKYLKKAIERLQKDQAKGFSLSQPLDPERTVVSRDTSRGGL